MSPGSLSDLSRPLWRALDAWMDLIDKSRLDDVTTLLLVANDSAPDGSAASSLRSDGNRDVKSAEKVLLAAAGETALATRHRRAPASPVLITVTGASYSQKSLSRTEPQASVISARSCVMPPG